MTALDDFILSYKDGDEIVVDLFSYYENYIRNLDDRFKPYSFYDNYSTPAVRICYDNSDGCSSCNSHDT